MLELLSSGVISLWLDMAGINKTGMNAVTLLAWQSGLPGLGWPSDRDAKATAMAEKYLQDLKAKGLLTQGIQGVWMQSGATPLVNVAGKEPLPAASLTKIATSLSALETWGHDHQFLTEIRATGPIKDGVLRGDLIVVGGGDAWFVWEEAIALGNTLQQMGIKKVEGNLVIVDNFWMNFVLESLPSGELLRQGMDASIWSGEIEQAYSKMPRGTTKPKLYINGYVKTLKYVPISKLLVRHQSLPLVAILKEMNVHSDNEMAEMLARGLGGAKVVAQQAAWSAGINQQEVDLKNGSGLGEDNHISPRAICSMLIAIERYLQNNNLTLGDIFPVAGRDEGTVVGRQIPKGAVVKTGTLDTVIALAGVLPTRDKGLVWFTIINRTNAWGELRANQDILLQNLVKMWGEIPAIPQAITPLKNSGKVILGDSNRNYPI